MLPATDHRSKTVVLGITGGIAAYKAVDVCRRLLDSGLRVLPVMTEEATRFVAPLTFSSLASEPARVSLFGTADPIPHTHLAREADIVVVLPATANFIAKIASGLADDLLSATVLASTAPMVICPAMHTEMWEHPAVQRNVETVKSFGVHIIPPENGKLAGGDTGIGRLVPVEVIVSKVLDILATLDNEQSAMGRRSTSNAGGGGDFHGIKVLVTAGGTRESIDPVRTITNRSSGKQGYAIARNAFSRGAEVTLVTTVDLPYPEGIQEIPVESASDMEQAVLQHAGEADVIVMAAAVADFRPAQVAGTKLHRTDGILRLELEPTPDILAEVAAAKRDGQLLVGFAAEVGMDESSARTKLHAKGIDLIVLNDITCVSSGFGSDDNEVLILGAGGLRVEVPLSSKDEVSRRILDSVLSLRPSTMS
ncbi:MAG: bifunctional phosphopantothenoylcysteine decarboxylase/phosphopantothenate--cysteine ligase CoaBC [Actinobacteria bacterium]|nr:bifunctional phosphopantothenoylcysteine decarboxylase/phosphopantothenate--cysteine ligase CoaBC [Actinomycetota bacterium]